MKKYNSYLIRQSKQQISMQDASLMTILMEFGESVDPQGYDAGDYDLAMIKLQQLQTAGGNIYKLNLDPSLFKKQRLTLGSIISSRSVSNFLTDEEMTCLEGIQNLLDEIADQAHDNHGLDVLNCED